MNPKVDFYLSDGCGRCSKMSTPDCKVHLWERELPVLRSLALSCGLSEDYKWSMPCYTYNDHNILMIAAFKKFCCISFFKGALLNDASGILTAPGENSQAVRQIRVTSIKEIVELEPEIKAYIFEAIEIEKAGLKIEFKKEPEHEIPNEFQTKLNEMPVLKMAFEALTPGRKRAYFLYFADAKQAKTREARIEKVIPYILKGKGPYDV